MTETAQEPFDLHDRALRDHAVSAALGQRPFDYLIKGGVLVDVVTGELRPADVGVCGPLISSVHAPGSLPAAEEVIDASGRFLSPGLIDAHMHIESSMVTPAGYAAAVLPRGVTTLVWDPHELANVHGLPGVEWALEAVSELPLRVVVLVPSCVPSAPGYEMSGADFHGADIAQLLRRPAVGGVAEVMNMHGVIERRDHVSDVVQAGLESGKPVCGHARGLAGKDLNAFVAAGISSDHELVSGDDLIAKLRAGLTIELRGSHDHLLPEFVAELNKLGHLPSTVTLCTDDVFPDDLDAKGGLDQVVRRLVACGLPAGWALRAATLNAASRLGRADLGLIAPGRRADIAVFEDLSEFKVDRVLINGMPLLGNRRFSSSFGRTDTSALQGSVKCARLTADDFKVCSAGSKVKVATIHRPRFTEWKTMETDVRDGCVVPPKSSTLISVVHRHGRRPAAPKTGYLTGWGDWKGAFCTTISHDSHNLTVFGGNEADMAVAANWVIAHQGGMAVAKDGAILAALALPLSGLITDAPLNETALKFQQIKAAMKHIVMWQPPYLVFKACVGASLACNAGPHQTDLGIADTALDRLMETPVLDILS